MIRLGRKYFGLDAYENLHVVEANAIHFVAQSDTQYDMLVVDLFIDDRVPAAAEQAEFLRNAEKLLRPGGHLLFNRLMHTPRLRQQTEQFTRMMNNVLPGTRSTAAEDNRILIYEKPDPN